MLRAPAIFVVCLLASALLRPAISTKLNMVVYDDLWKEDLPDGAPVPKIGDEQKGKDGKQRKMIQV